MKKQEGRRNPPPPSPSCPQVSQDDRDAAGSSRRVLKPLLAMEEATGGPGAASAPALPPEVVEEEKNFRHSVTSWADAARRIRRSMNKAEQQGAGQVSITPTDPAELAAFLGLAWPRRGTSRCRRCPDCRAGGCRAQALPTKCAGCLGGIQCENLVCHVPYQPPQPPPGQKASTATTANVTAETMSKRIAEMKVAGEQYRAAYRTYTDALRAFDCDTEDNPARSLQILDQERHVRCGEEEDLLEQAEVQQGTLERDESLNSEVRLSTSARQEQEGRV